MGDVDAGGCLVCLVAGLGYWVCFGGVFGFCLGWDLSLRAYIYVRDITT